MENIIKCPKLPLKKSSQKGGKGNGKCSQTSSVDVGEDSAEELLECMFIFEVGQG